MFFSKTLNLIHVLRIVIIRILPNYRIMNYHYSMYLFNQNKFMNIISLIKSKLWIYSFLQQTKITFNIYLINLFNQNKVMNVISLIKYKSWIYPFLQQTKITFDVYLINILQEH